MLSYATKLRLTNGNYMLKNKNIIVGITAGIAAYKIPELVRRLKEHGANVRVVMTKGSQAFITPLTLQAVSGTAVADDLLDPQAELGMGHIELAKWADLVLIAPATADFIARANAGMANDLLSTLCLATAAPIALAPAMNQQMWHNKITQQNCTSLQAYGFQLWGPAAGEQACGDVGLGRMLDVPDLVQHCLDFFAAPVIQPLTGQQWLITAGPTREAIDPVRYISNHSSGKMGYAIAQAATEMGANVTIISGPVNLPVPENCQVVNVTSAEQMHQQAMALSDNAQVFVACAAVADYRLAQVAEQKIKKHADAMQLSLVKNPDIVASVAAKNNKPFVVGFAAETENLAEYAKGKLQRKKLDLIAANDVSNSKQGFNSDHNALTVFSATDETTIDFADKQQVAKQLVSLIARKYQAQLNQS
jgi:phosphopantothenoylcysteine decarboxylase/phosphopantothenate--cysteine ligase